MLNLNRNNFQAHPFHLVSPFPFPLYTSIISLSLTTSAVLSFHKFAWGLYFQDSASPQMEALVELHDNIMYYLVVILFSVGWIQGAIIRNFDSSKSPISNKYLNHGTLIELIWTITPALILVLIAFPSFKLLYLMDEVTDPSLSVLAEGHQWYWSYEYPDFLNSDGDFIEFDSYLVPESNLEDGSLRMLEVDNRVTKITENGYLFKPIQCASPSKANEAFQNLEVVVKPRLEEAKGIISHPAPNIDFTSIDRMLAELKSNSSSMTDLRIANFEADIKGNLDQLKRIADDTFKSFGFEIFQIIKLFSDLSRINEFKDLQVVMGKVVEMVNEDIPKPAQSLLNTDPVKYWLENVNFANKQHNNNTHILKLFKDYIKYNNVLSSQDKTTLFTVIKNMNKTSSNIADTDKLIFKQNIESSKILMELKNKRGR